ncbi:hypothetical protein EJB05_13977 [Eragrostis curvula]|uniref:Uncharacterized protein n=1 Tax=Eragrostis curvula TaxID=38414 RepID=A0A5J9VZI0_9POAL|nr:hypothetical protein EJB05_13977 [Eragrostis curvula]
MVARSLRRRANGAGQNSADRVTAAPSSTAITQRPHWHPHPLVSDCLTVSSTDAAASSYSQVRRVTRVPGRLPRCAAALRCDGKRSTLAETGSWATHGGEIHGSVRRQHHGCKICGSI